MERSVRTISRKKFQALPARRRHALLAALAGEAVADGDMRGFLHRYEELQAATSLDRYVPPPWLTDSEALEEYRAFHAALSMRPWEPICSTGAEPIAWRPRFQVEIVIDQVRSPYNVGSILRLIDNFGLAGLVHATRGLRLDHPQLRKSARGCERWIPVRHEPDLAGWLAGASVPVIGIECTPDAVPLSQWRPPPACLLVLGNETYGMAERVRRMCCAAVRVPMFGFKTSMNVSHALAVVAQRIVDALG
jgi:tRNA G18 (ribose-2'-O)-methylase SpoU